MVLEHAPVTGLALLFSSISAAITSDKYNRPPHRVSLRRTDTAAATKAAALLSQTSTLTRWRRMCIESIPFGGLGATVEDMILAAGILVQMRSLERRWGSASFLSFLLHAAGAGVCVLHLLSGPPTSETGGLLDVFIPADGSNGLATGGRGPTALFFTQEAVRVLTGAASLVPLTALVVRYMTDIPSSSARGGRGLRIPGTSVVLTERVTFVLPLLKLILAPNGVLQPPTHKRDGIMVSVGLWTRLLLALVGLLFGLASTRSPWLRWWLHLVAEKVCKPVLNAVRPVLLTPIFGSQKVVTHAVPPHIQQQQEQHVFPVDHMNAARGDRVRGPGTGDDVSRQDGGRISVGSLSGAGQAWPHPRPRARGGENEAALHAAAHPPAHRVNAEDHADRARSGGAGVDPAAVALILEMGLGRSEQDVANALRACNGDVEAAVNLLLATA